MTSLLAYCTELKPGTVTGLLGDTHIYVNHLDGVKTMLHRTPQRLPQLICNLETDPNGMLNSILNGLLRANDFQLTPYNHYGKIIFDMASS